MNGTDKKHRYRPLIPDVNVGPTIAFGGKGRKRPSRISPCQRAWNNKRIDPREPPACLARSWARRAKHSADDARPFDQSGGLMIARRPAISCAIVEIVGGSSYLLCRERT